jgi:hypothetical protein
VSPFRREPLHIRLARKGGLLGSPGEDRRAPWDKAGIHGVHRPRQWDAVATVEADVAGDEARFVVLDREIVIEEGPDDVEPLAEAVSLEPPFRAEASRAGEQLWSVGARTIDVVELPGQGGDELEYVVRGDERELRVDGARTFGTLPNLEREGDHVVRARRLTGELWEVESSPL